MGAGGGAPGASDADHHLILVDAIAVLVALELFTVFEYEAGHIISGHATLLNVLASGIEACIRGLCEAGLEW